jgi:hypothetical protein
MTSFTGLLPAALALSDESQLSRMAASAPFFGDWIAKAAATDVERYVEQACERGDLVERAMLFRIVQRQNGRLGDVGAEWLKRLAGAVYQT